MTWFLDINKRLLSLALAVLLGTFGLPAAFAYADDEADAPQVEAEQAGSDEKTPEKATDAAPAASDDGQAASDAASQAANEEPPAPEAPADTKDSASIEDAGKDGASKDDTSKADAKKDEANKDEAGKDEADKEKKLAEATDTYERAAASAASAASMLAGMGALQAQLTPYFNELAQAWDALEFAQAMREPLEKEREECLEARESLLAGRDVVDAQRAEALYRFALAERELALTGGVDLVSVVAGTSNPTDAESMGYFLERVAAVHAAAKLKAESMRDAIDERIEAVDTRIEAIDAELARVEERTTQAQENLEDIVDAGNMAAFAIEKLASEARQESKGAIEAIEKLDGAIEGVDDMKKAAADWDLKSNGTRAQALAEAGQWYDAVDALVDLDGAISYGCGLDFALDEEDFVAKWGAAIDIFFGAQGAPLQGYGSEMARQAYRYKVDPRLCAAVSIVESSGGRYCIKPHNAWGWGAADSDPYNLASGWSSWESAIESWHRGMATSQTGLATTPSLTAMGDIYCSTPIWGSRVATLMEQISGYAQIQQVVFAL